MWILKHKLIASFTRRNVKYKVTVDRISRRYCVKSQKSFVACILFGCFFLFIYFFFWRGGANANKFMCTFYRISYIYLMHLPMNANRFSSSWIKIQSNWEIGAGCSGYIIVCKAAVYKVNSNCFHLLFLNWRSLAREKYTDHHLVTLPDIKKIIIKSRGK